MGKYSTKSDLVSIIRKYVGKKVSVEERKFLDTYYDHFDRQEDILDSLSEEEKIILLNDIEQNIIRKINKKEKQKTILRSIYRPLIAASLLLTIGFATYFYFTINSLFDQKQEVVIKRSNLAPEEVKSAVLTLANGDHVILDDIKDGESVEDVGVGISKSSDGTLVYSIKNNYKNKQTLSYNTISTPKGGQYQVNLPDGTKVWLNAESSLKYPTHFDQYSREVELNGEAYFEVAKSKKKPFFVKAKNAQVKVLGTHFNISAYNDDEFMKTTLIEGSVMVKKSDNKTTLKPGSQAITYNTLPDITVKQVDIEEALAWKNGYFKFNGEDIRTVMKIITRWYDIKVEYEEDVKNEMFIGTISRFDSIEKLLKTIELTGGVHFKIEDNIKTKKKMVIVMP